jgi:hypothetical protein
MAITRQQLNKFYKDLPPYLDEVIGQDFAEHPTIYSQFLNIKSATAGWKDTATISGFSTFSSKAELEDAASDDILQGPTMRTAMVTFAKRNLISQEAIEDEQGHGIVASRLPEMMFAGRATQEILGHDLINNGNVDTFFKTPDGKALFATDHVDLSGGTYSNKIAQDFTQTQLEAAVSMLQNMKNDRGIPIFNTAQTLLVPPDLEFAAKVVLGSALDTTALTNKMNPMQGKVNLIVSPYLTDASGWTLFGNNHKLNFIWRVKPENWSEVNYVNSSVQIGMRFRCAVEALDPRAVVHSTGAS